MPVPVTPIHERYCRVDFAALGTGVSNSAQSLVLKVGYGLSRGETRADQAEDRVVIAHGGGIAGVFDGVSGLYHPAEGPRRFGARNQYSGGQLVGAIVKNSIARSDTSRSLPEILTEANREVRRALTQLLPPGASPVDTPAVTGAVWKRHLTPDGVPTLQIATWGDSFALVVFRNGTMHLTENQTEGVDRTVFGIRDNITRRITDNYRLPITDQVRNQIWSEYIPLYRAVVDSKIHQPGGYGMLNGDTDFPAYVQHMNVPIEEIDTVLCCTDGVLVGDSRESPQSLGKRLVDSFREGGIGELLATTRRAQEQEAQNARLLSPTFPEATVVSACRE